MENPINYLEMSGAFFYSANTDAGKLELYLRTKGIDQIGDINIMAKKYQWDRRFDADPDWTPKTSMSTYERIVRTVLIKQMSFEGLTRIHKAEMGRAGFYSMDSEVKAFKWVNREEVFNNSLENDEYDAVNQFNLEHRPPYKKEFEGHTIPPFFLYDCNFDPMEFHHEWDWAVWKEVLVMPRKNPSSLVDAVERLNDKP